MPRACLCWDFSTLYWFFKRKHLMDILTISVIDWLLVMLFRLVVAAAPLHSPLPPSVSPVWQINRRNCAISIIHKRETSTTGDGSWKMGEIPKSYVPRHSNCSDPEMPAAAAVAVALIVVVAVVVGHFSPLIFSARLKCARAKKGNNDNFWLWLCLWICFWFSSLSIEHPQHWLCLLSLLNSLVPLFHSLYI